MTGLAGAAPICSPNRRVDQLSRRSGALLGASDRRASGRSYGHAEGFGEAGDRAGSIDAAQDGGEGGAGAGSGGYLGWCGACGVEEGLSGGGRIAGLQVGAGGLDQVRGAYNGGESLVVRTGREGAERGKGLRAVAEFDGCGQAGDADQGGAEVGVVMVMTGADLLGELSGLGEQGGGGGRVHDGSASRRPAAPMAGR